MSNDIAVQQPSPQLVTAGFFDLQGFELIQRVASLFAASTLVPKEYQRNVANCTIAINLAGRMRADPLMVMQNLDLIHGKPSLRAQFLIATVNTCGRFTPLSYQWKGAEGDDEWGCYATAMSRATGEVLDGTTITIRMAKEEGWYARNGSKWKTMPKQMLMYRAAAFWTRAYAPELSLGLPTSEEAHDIIDLRNDGSGTYSVSDRATEIPSPPKDMKASLDAFAVSEGAILDIEPDTELVQSPAAIDAVSAAYEQGKRCCENGGARNYPTGSGYYYKAREAEGEAFLRGYDEVAIAQGRMSMI